MGTIKLTKGMRNNIVNDITSGLQLEVRRIRDEGSKLAQQLYEETFSPEERGLMSSLPEGWLMTFDTFYVEAFGVDPRPTRVALKLPFRERRPYEFDTHPNTIELPKTFHDNYRAWFFRLEQAQERLDQAKRKAGVVLHSVTTVGRLLEVWPEIEPAVQRCVGTTPTQSGQALALPIGELNNVLKLPEKVDA